MNFIKLGKRYINLDAITIVVPRKKGLGYTVNFIGGTQTDICEMDMADIRRTLEMASTREVVLDIAKCTIGGVEYFKKGATHE